MAASRVPSFVLSDADSPRFTRRNDCAIALAASARTAGTESRSVGSSTRPSSGRWNRPSPRTATRRKSVSLPRRASSSGANPSGAVPRASSATSSRCKAAVSTATLPGACAIESRGHQITRKQRPASSPRASMRGPGVGSRATTLEPRREPLRWSRGAGYAGMPG